MGFREMATIGSIDSYLGEKADQDCFHSVSDKNGNNLHSDSDSYNGQIRPCYLVSHN